MTPPRTPDQLHRFGYLGPRGTFTQMALDAWDAAEGREQTFYACTPCHGFKIVAQQGQSRERWNDTLDWMTQRHAMPRPSDNDRKVLLDYLEAAFPARAPRGWQNPFQR